MSQSDRAGPPHNPGLRSLIENKRKWHRPERTLSPEGVSSPGPTKAPWTDGSPGHQPSGRNGSPFLGWHERGYLPHCDAPRVTQFVTFMLHDAFPVTRRREWEGILGDPQDSQRRRRLEAWLDRGHGDCWLRHERLAGIVEAQLLAENGKAYGMKAWVVMPNHVHLVVDVWATPLSKLIQRWKGASARAANRVLNRTGRFWEPEYFDTLIRDEEHLKQAVRYTERNPVRGFLVQDPGMWRWSSARSRDEYERLPGRRAEPPESWPRGGQAAE